MQVMTPLKNLKKWRVIQANTLWWLSLPSDRAGGDLNTRIIQLYPKHLKRHTEHFRG